MLVRPAPLRRALEGLMDIAYPTCLVSPLQIADRLIQLAQEAEAAGYAATAATLVGLAYAVLDGDVPYSRARLASL